MNLRNLPRSRAFLLLVFGLFCSFSPARAAADPYGELLKRVVTGEGVRWKRWGTAEKKLLDEYLATVSKADPASLPSVEAQLAFWINAHNACVMKLIADRLPMEDVMAIDGFRDRLKCTVAGTPRSLIDIESGVIRPLFADPRVHFALWWGAKGSPRLAATPYDEKNLRRALDERTKSAVRNARFVRYDGASKTFTLSPIFDWYKSDFGPKDNDVLDFVRGNLAPEEARALPKSLAEVSFGPFDWSLDAVTD